jgi:hypothetical protein
VRADVALAAVDVYDAAIPLSIARAMVAASAAGAS